MASLKRIDADPKASSLPDSATAYRPASPASTPSAINKKQAEPKASLVRGSLSDSQSPE